MALAPDAIGQHDHGRDDAREDRLETAGFRVIYRGQGYGWHVIEVLDLLTRRYVSGPWTSKAQAQADADARAAA